MKKSLLNSLTIKAIAFFALLFLLAPILIVIFYSFNSSKIMTIWGGFSLDWYQELFQDKEIFIALSNSIIVAFTSSVLSVTISIIFSMIIVRKKSSEFFRKLLSIMITIQFAIPEIILGISMLMLFVFIRETFNLKHSNDMLNLIIAHSVLTTAYATTIITAKLANIPDQIFESAEDLGATSLAVFTQITFPLIFPAIVNAWLLSFILSMDDVVVATFNNGPGSTTLPILIASRIRLGISPEINSLATIIILIVSIFLVMHFCVNNIAKGDQNSNN